MTRMRRRLEYLAGAYGPIVARHVLRSLRWRGPVTDEDIVYITFDDGPTSELTPAILETLSRYSAEATFFFLGRQVDAFPEHARSVRDAGHAVGLHGYQHYDAWRISSTTAIDDVENGCRSVADLLGEDPDLYRPPYGHLTPALYRWAVDNGMDIVMWGVMPGDYLGNVDAKRIASRAVRRKRRGSIIVLHDSHNQTVQKYTVPALELILRHLRESGWRSESLSRLDPA